LFVALLVACCLAGGGFAAYMLMSGGSIGNDLRYLPDNSDFVTTMDVHGLWTSHVYESLKANPRIGQMVNQAMAQATNAIRPEDIGRVTFGGVVAGEQVCGVVHFMRPVTDADLTTFSNSGVKKQVGSLQMTVERGMAYARIDDRTFAFGSEAILPTVLQRGAAATLPPAVAAAMKEVDFSGHFALVLSTATLKNIPQSANTAGILAMIPGGADGVRAVALQSDLDRDIRMKAAVICKDGKTADDLKKMADGGLAMVKANPNLPPPAGKIINSVSVSNSGNVVAANATIDADTIDMLLATIPAATGTAGEAAPPFGGGAPAITPPNIPRAPIAPRPENNVAGGALNRPPKIGGSNAVEAGRKMQSFNNLRQIGLALLNAENTDRHFPPPAICDAAGQPLLSWRVAILPYLGEEKLYKDFDLTQPWDSPKNKRLLIRMPTVYHVPGTKVHGIGKTAYLAPIGQNAAFFGTQGRKPADFKGGLSRTIVLVEAAPDRAVPWTKPDDLTINDASPTDGLFGLYGDGCAALFGDGHTQLLRADTQADLVRDAFSLNGGKSLP
jgi:hypothetical protein